MGRTNPTFRDYLRSFRERWEKFRRGLRKQYKSDFDRMFEHAERHADAAGYMNSTEPETAILISILLAHETELGDIDEKVESLEMDLQEFRERLDQLENHSEAD